MIVRHKIKYTIYKRFIRNKCYACKRTITKKQCGVWVIGLKEYGYRHLKCFYDEHQGPYEVNVTPAKFKYAPTKTIESEWPMNLRGK